MDNRKKIGKVVWVVCEFIIVCLVIVVFDWVFHNPMCDLMFNCGCTWNWDGGWDECNIHNDTGPHCPWCNAKPSTAWTTQWGVMAMMLFSYYLVAYWRTWKNLIFKGTNDERKFNCIIDLSIVNILSRMVVPVLAFIISSILVGFGFYLSTDDYPSFLFH